MVESRASLAAIPRSNAGQRSGDCRRTRLRKNQSPTRRRAARPVRRRFHEICDQVDPSKRSTVPRSPTAKTLFADEPRIDYSALFVGERTIDHLLPS